MTTPSKEYMKKYREKNKKKIAKQVKEYQEKHSKEIREYKRGHWKDWIAKNRDRKTANNAKWRQENKGMVNAGTARRRASKLERTPDWLTEEDLDKIKAIYDSAHEMSQKFGRKYHVDHIVPLRGENVSGLHVPWNLQIMLSTLNESKGNKHEW